MAKPQLPALLILLAVAGFTVWAWPALPERIPTHFDLAGRPDAWSSRGVGVLVVPVVCVLVLLLFNFLPKIDPLRRNFEANAPVWWSLLTVLMLVMAAVQLLLVGSGLGWRINSGTVIGVAVGGLFVVLGYLIPRLRPNWFLGIRTPWTLSSESVWRQTHRLGGYLFIAAGLGIMGVGLIRSQASFIVALVLAVVAVVVPVVYSGVLWWRETGGGRTGPGPAQE